MLYVATFAVTRKINQYLQLTFVQLWDGGQCGRGCLSGELVVGGGGTPGLGMGWI